jgi:hypothetical protein
MAAIFHAALIFFAILASLALREIVRRGGPFGR